MSNPLTTCSSPSSRRSNEDLPCSHALMSPKLVLTAHGNDEDVADVTGDELCDK